VRRKEESEVFIAEKKKKSAEDVHGDKVESSASIVTGFGK